MNKIIPIYERWLEDDDGFETKNRDSICLKCKNATIIVAGGDCMIYCSKLFKNVWQSGKRQKYIHDCSAFEDSETEED